MKLGSCEGLSLYVSPSGETLLSRDTWGSFRRWNLGHLLAEPADLRALARERTGIQLEDLRSR